MSLDTIALFDRTVLDATPARLLQRLSADTDFATDLIAHYRTRWQPQAWALEPSSFREYPELVGPGGFALTWRGHLLQLYHMMPFFRVFAGDAWSRQALQQACRMVAAVVGSSAVLYTHELMPYQGDDLQALAQSLTTKIGPPAVDVGELQAAEAFGPRAWYVERIAAAGRAAGA